MQKWKSAYVPCTESDADPVERDGTDLHLCNADRVNPGREQAEAGVSVDDRSKLFIIRGVRCRRFVLKLTTVKRSRNSCEAPKIEEQDRFGATTGLTSNDTCDEINSTPHAYLAVLFLGLLNFVFQSLHV